MATDENERSQTSGAIVVGNGGGDAVGGVGGRAGGGQRTRAATKGNGQRPWETQGGKASQAIVATARQRGQLPGPRPTHDQGRSDPRGRGAHRTRGGRSVAQADLCAGEADEQWDAEM